MTQSWPADVTPFRKLVRSILALCFAYSVAIYLSTPATALIQRQGRRVAHSRRSIARPLSASEIFQRSKSAVYQIETTFQEKGVDMVGSGSGFAFLRPGLIVTAYHVVRGANTIKVVDRQGRPYTPTWITYNEGADVAVIRVNSPSEGAVLQPKPFGDVQTGETVYTIGNVLGVLPESLSEGIVSGKRKVAGQPFIQITAPISQGDSGGPVLDEKGRVIGIVSYYLTHGQNVNMAAASNEASFLAGKKEWQEASGFEAFNALDQLGNSKEPSAPAPNPEPRVPEQPNAYLPQPDSPTIWIDPSSNFKISVEAESPEQTSYLAGGAISTDGTYSVCWQSNQLTWFSGRTGTFHAQNYDSDVAGAGFGGSDNLFLALTDGRLLQIDPVSQQTLRSWQANQKMSHIKVAPDGQHVFFPDFPIGSIGDLSKWRLLDLDLVQNRVSVTQTDFGIGGDFDFSHDGTVIVGESQTFDGNNLHSVVREITSDGESLFNLRDDVSFVELPDNKSITRDFTSPTFSPDGRTLAVLETTMGGYTNGLSTQLMTVNPSNGLTKRTYNFDSGYASGLRFTSDDSEILIGIAGGIGIYDLDKARFQATVMNLGFGEFFLSTDRSTILVTSGKKEYILKLSPS